MSEFPYPGLRSFRRDETDIFFGRDEQTDELLERLSRSRFLAVVGPSGCGKSSLVRTGLIAALETGFLAEAGVRWRIAAMRPRDQPLTNLALALLDDTALGPEHPEVADAATRDYHAAFLRANLECGPLGLRDILNQTPLPKNTNLLLLVDQFEEIFRYRRLADSDEADAFVALLLESARQESWPIYVVMTMRSDFLGDCAVFSGLPEAINCGQFLTPRLTRDQLREAIEGPTEVFGGQVEPALTNRLLNEMGGDPDQLPVLQHALMRMYVLAAGYSTDLRPVDSRSTAQFGTNLSLQDCEQVGGLKQALFLHVDRAFLGLDETQQHIAQRLFLALTERDQGERDTRRPATIREVAGVAQVDWREVAAVVEVFRRRGRCFIMPPDPECLAPETLLDISHESLIRQWKRLREWVNSEARSADMYRRLEDTAERWKQGQAALYVTPDLELAQREGFTKPWSQRYGDHHELAMEFLNASEQQQLQQRAELEEARRREVRRRIWQVGSGVAICLIAVLAFAGWMMLGERQRMRNLYDTYLMQASYLVRDEDYAAATTTLAQTRPFDSEVLAPRRHARNLIGWYAELMGSAPVSATQVAPHALQDVAISTDGHWLAAAGEEGTLLLFDTERGDIPHPLQGGSCRDSAAPVRRVAFDPQGEWLASAGNDGCLVLWSLPDGRVLREWRSDQEIHALAVSPDGSRLASAGADRRITLWDPRTGAAAPYREDHEQTISSLAFSPDGGTLASASWDQTIRRWNVDKGELILPVLNDPFGPAGDIAFSPDSASLASSGYDNTVRLWMLDGGNKPLPPYLFFGPKAYVTDLAFMAGGRQLLSASIDHTLRIWDIDSRVTVRVFQGHSAAISALAVREDRAYSADRAGTILSWDLTPPSATRLLRPETATTATVPVTSVAIAPDASNVAVALANGGLRLYGLPDNEMRWALPNAFEFDANCLSASTGPNDAPDPGHCVQHVAFGPDGKTIATAGPNGRIMLRQAFDGKLIRTLSSHTGPVNAVAFSPQGQRLASAGADGFIGVYELDGSGEAVFRSPHRNVLSVSFGPDGKHLLSTGIGGGVQRWNIDGSLPIAQSGGWAAVLDDNVWARLGAGGDMLVAAGTDKAVRIYAPDGDDVISLDHGTSIESAALSPDGWQLATFSFDPTAGARVRFWDLQSRMELFALHLPSGGLAPAGWDFDFRCAPNGLDGKAGRCWVAAPLTDGGLALYDLGNPYD